MKLHVIYDDTAIASARVTSLIGITHFGKLIYRRHRLADHLRDAVSAAGIDSIIELHSAQDLTTLADRRRQGDMAQDRFLICPSHIVSTRQAEAIVQFLKQAVHAPGSLLLQVPGAAERDSWLLLNAGQLSDYLAHRAADDLASFFDARRDELIFCPDKLDLIDLSDDVVLLDFLSGAFDVRFFNSLVRDRYTITKRSTDKIKLKREYAFYGLLPPAMQMFFVQPFDFADEGEVAAYRMERLFMPDMALQTLHGAIDQREFALFLDKVFHFVGSRARRVAGAAEADAEIEKLYVTKVRERIEQLKQTEHYPALAPYLDRMCGGIDALFDRYMALFAKARGRFPTDHMVIGHGDLCFSNILYGKTMQMMRLIDPRGASSEADLYTNPYYDLAKLSHSIVGGYDLINHDMFDVEVNADLQPQLRFDRPPADWAMQMFADRLKKAGFDVELVRICEASLFISMLALHIDRPRKVLGFAVNAANIVTGLEISMGARRA